MAATAADVRSILSIPESSSTIGPSQPKKSGGLSTRKPEGISRELYSLIGPSAPSLAAQLAKPRLKQRPNLGGGGKVKWCDLANTGDIYRIYILTSQNGRECRAFRNNGRQDSLELRHWVKATTEPDSGTQSITKR